MTSSQIRDPLGLEGPSNSPLEADLVAGPHRDSGRRRVGPIVAGSLIAGFVAAAVLVAMPFVGTRESTVTGVVLFGFALGWALLAVLSTRWSDQPQRWAWAPAAFMAVAGTILVVGSEAAVPGVLDWVWPPALLALVAWMVVQARRRLRSRTRAWLLYPVFAVLVAAALGGGYQTVRTSGDARAHPMVGQMVDVGGHRLHLQCTGSGSPTVVLEPGLGEISSLFGWIAPAVARETRVCVYDRAGRGWSESGPGPQDGVQIATDLHTLLDRAHVPGPYVLAGHSFGGLYVLAFAARYPDQVAGLVLLDSTAPTSATPGNAGSYNVVGRALSVVPTLARLGGVRLVCSSGYASLPAQARDEERSFCATPRQVRSFIDEFGASTTAMAQAGALTDLAGKPLAVVTAASGANAEWMAAQEDLATLSSNTIHRVVAGATHGSLVESETDAAAASRAILDVVAAVRTHQPLPTA
jgi:pimeloyl-ACP methyl ester carboxylesterase